MAGRAGEVFDNALFEALYQRTFTALAVLKQLCVALIAENIDGFGGALFIGFCHEVQLACWTVLVKGLTPDVLSYYKALRSIL